MLARTLAVTVGFGLLSGCHVLCAYDCYNRDRAPPKLARTSVTVIPASTDSHIGTVVVDPEEGRMVLNQAYASANAFAGGDVVAFQSSREDVESNYGELLRSRPLPPVSLTAYFELGTDRISDESAEVIYRLRGEVARRASSEITVIGHTDRVGTIEHNDQLAEQRALRVREQLIALGFQADIIEVESRGEREPVVETADGKAEASNRRVEINIR